MTDPRLAERRAAWHAKAALKAVYEHDYRRIADACVPGPILADVEPRDPLKTLRRFTLCLQLELSDPGFEARRPLGVWLG